MSADEDVDRLYRSMAKTDLLRLRAAFTLDRMFAEETGVDAAFCTKRIAIIDRILGPLVIPSTPRAAPRTS